MPLLCPKCCRFSPSKRPFSVLRQSAKCPFSSAKCTFSSAKCPFFTLAFLLALYLLALHAQKSKKRSSAPWPTPTLLRNSNKNKQYVATITIRRPSHRHCRSDYAG